MQDVIVVTIGCLHSSHVGGQKQQILKSFCAKKRVLFPKGYIFNVLTHNMVAVYTTNNVYKTVLEVPLFLQTIFFFLKIYL